MLIGLSNVSNLLQPISCFLPILVTILIIFCYHSNGKSQINIRYLQIKKENDEKQFLFFSLLGGGGGGGGGGKHTYLFVVFFLQSLG